jgi:4-hydroxybenzoate polyprenyltransferase
MKSLFRLYQIVNILSLDVAVGAMICAAFFADLFTVTILPQGFASLGLAVWLIYTVDHLLDARKLKDKASTMRHQFHHIHFKLLIALVIIAICIEMILIFFLRAQIFRSGVVLAAMVVVYILLNRWIKYAKEIAAAAIYCLGVWLPVFSLKPDLMDFKNVVLMLPFGLIVLTNLILFSWMDYEKDCRDQQQSMITLIGKKQGTFIIIALFIALIVIFVFAFKFFPGDVVFIYGLMALALIFIFFKQKYFHENDRFRYLGDLIFLFPLLHWIL